ncbi:acyl-CoA dehydrogenase [Marinobacter sp. AN1]|uniref:acyl-CoA dehydrogenase n=1 Tax=Marinobacter sp. AN1 TaxID=2886046 RepID=UPI0022305089|nr:acyl-CoA dehydrogenase [Marinobacter sp. AN1]UZD64585.1 acyl-CoA dehydrogenase [Marinobacter sp. AN1]
MNTQTERDFIVRQVLDSTNLERVCAAKQVEPSDLLGIAGHFDTDMAPAIGAINPLLDQEGATLTQGTVCLPEAMQSLYRDFCHHGWNGLACSPDFGGEGLPHLCHAFLRETLNGKSLAFGLLHDLNFGFYKALSRHGSDELRAHYLEKVVSGKWTATMCLTEPHCGTDLGLIRTVARRDLDNGHWKISGNKIFITWGDHNLTDNIVHLVLARSGEPGSGLAGLSLFLVPKWLGAESAQRSNQVQTMGIENKMGIHGSPTCALAFDESVGWLVGNEGEGLRCMFTMMNAARVSVGLQGLGTAQEAYDKALSYAGERRQGKAPVHEGTNTRPPHPIIEHPDIQRRFRDMEARITAARVLTYDASLLLDLADLARNEDEALEIQSRLEIYTPVLKYALSELGSSVANECMQVLGGHGYIHENGIEQLVRDVRIASIYEGTNAIQARDLVQRKLLKQFVQFESVFDEVAVSALRLSRVEGFADQANALTHLNGRIKNAGSILIERMENEDPDVSAEFCGFLEAFYLLLCGSAWARIITACCNQESRFHRDKVNTGRFFFRRILPEADLPTTIIETR